MVDSNAPVATNRISLVYIIPFFFRYVDSAIRGSGRSEEPSGGSPPPDSDPFSEADFEKISSARQEEMSGIAKFAYRARLTRVIVLLRFTASRIKPRPNYDRGPPLIARDMSIS